MTHEETDPLGFDMVKSISHCSVSELMPTHSVGYVHRCSVGHAGYTNNQHCGYANEIWYRQALSLDPRFWCCFYGGAPTTAHWFNTKIPGCLEAYHRYMECLVNNNIQPGPLSTHNGPYQDSEGSG